MKSPLFNAMNGGNMQNGPMGMMQHFQQFMKQMQGQDANALLDEVVRSGRINQEQLNQVQQRAQQMQSMFNGMRGMFGF